MLEPRAYTPAELLAWCRFTSLALLGTALGYVREREGTTDGFLEHAATQLGQLWGSMGASGVEATTLSLLLTVEALGADIRSRAMNPEEGEVVVSDLPGAGLVESLADHFDIEITPEELPALAGVSVEELNKLYDLLGAAMTAGAFDFEREPGEPDGQRLLIRA